MGRNIGKLIVAALKAYQLAVDEMLTLAGTGRHTEFIAAADRARTASDYFKMAMSDYREHVIQHISAPR